MGKRKMEGDGKWTKEKRKWDLLERKEKHSIKIKLICSEKGKMHLQT
jgi:hypothetical protein